MVHWSKNPEMRARVLEKVSKTHFKAGEPSWNRGLKMDVSWSERISKQNTGNTPWNKGKAGCFSEETREKMSIAKKGKKPSTWKGGISSVQSRVYASSQNKFWREEVFRRDNWTCQICGLQGDLEAHHIIPMNQMLNSVMIEGLSVDEKVSLAMAIPTMFDPENGVTLCKSCHYSKHKRRIRCKK